MPSIKSDAYDLSPRKGSPRSGHLLVKRYHLGKGRDFDVGTIADMGLSWPMDEDQVGGLTSPQKWESSGGGWVEESSYYNR